LQDAGQQFWDDKSPMNNHGKGSLAGTAVSSSTIGDTSEADALESINLTTKMGQAETLGCILDQLELLNARFEEAFRTGIKLKDIDNVY
jgi:hypothetical protein